jgi:hypothetical protein
VLYPRWVRFFFLEGVAIDDPEGRLEGTGNQVRSIRLDERAAIVDCCTHTRVAELESQIKNQQSQIVNQQRFNNHQSRITNPSSSASYNRATRCP